MNRPLVLALAAAICAYPFAAGAQPSLSATAAPTAAAKTSSSRPTSTQIHRAIVVCDREPFYVWPDRSSAPQVSGYSLAVRGEGFGIVGDATLAYGQVTLYETTIETFSPYGSGSQHFWIRAACVDVD